MTTYRVDSTAVLPATTQATQTIDRIHQDVSTLTAALQSLSGVWTGSAATAFQEVYSSWRTTQATVEAHLQELATALGQAGTHYQDMEIANTALFRR
jgi:WXG100 family type VII secretion target